MTKRAVTSKKRPLVVVFGESENDRRAVAHVVRGIRADLSRVVEERRQPLVLIKGSNPKTTRTNAERISAVVRQEAAARDMLAVLAHEDCNAIEPAHEVAAIKIETVLAAAKCQAPVIAVTPAWEIEAWWMIFPKAVGKVVAGWRRLRGPVCRGFRLRLRARGLLRGHGCLPWTGYPNLVAASPAITEERHVGPVDCDRFLHPERSCGDELRPRCPRGLDPHADFASCPRMADELRELLESYFVDVAKLACPAEAECELGALAAFPSQALQPRSMWLPPRINSTSTVTFHDSRQVIECVSRAREPWRGRVLLCSTSTRTYSRFCPYSGQRRVRRLAHRAQRRRSVVGARAASGRRICLALRKGRVLLQQTILPMSMMTQRHVLVMARRYMV